jgi:hypothetical protein
MGKIVAAITMSVDGYITGPDDGPGKGLGEGGERLHYWVMGGPWSYENEPQVEPEGEDAEIPQRDDGAGRRDRRGPHHVRGLGALGR